MQEIQQSLAGLKLGAPQAYRNLAVFALVAPGDAPAGYLRWMRRSGAGSRA